jgi:UDP-N-acetylmuramoyl-tripeptide--D-alanyl-D-alanine ligase
MTTAIEVLTLVAGLVAAALAGIRWLRVAQREHYLPGSVSRFALRWWALGPNVIVALAGVIGVALAAVGATVVGIVTAAGVAVGPFGLTLRGRTSKLAWTRRLRTLAGVAGALSALLIVAVGVAAGLRAAAVTSVLVALLVPLIVDAALAVTAPIERQLASRFVDQAAARLRSVAPTVVAITGSYGKTSTKGYVAHLLGATHTVVPTPASFNNTAGLSRAVNEHLVPGTDVFIAEMGTYGPGEIADMCAWVRPSISVITAIGPVHLERFKSEDRIVIAKSEILETAEVAILNADNERLAALADRVEAAGGKKVVRVSAADVAGFNLPEGAAPTNVACAIAVARELGVGDDVIAARVPTLPSAPNRLTVGTGSSGSTIVDDTFNSNPAGAVAALGVLNRAAAPDGRRVVVTPGMVELGPRQADENARLAEAVATGAGTDLVIVGHTNRRALMEGAGRGNVRVVLVDTREQAVAWVREQCGPGDGILYENDLPDHYA